VVAEVWIVAVDIDEWGGFVVAWFDHAEEAVVSTREVWGLYRLGDVAQEGLLGMRVADAAVQ